MSQQNKRVDYLSVTEFYILQHAVIPVEQAFGSECYLVGSCTERHDYRDVDVRMILNDAKFSALFGEENRGEFWMLMCVCISEYLAKRTNLPIDFQIQRYSDISESDWAKPRNWLGGMLRKFKRDTPQPPWMSVKKAREEA